jgi:hypothetical protein
MYPVEGGSARMSESFDIVALQKKNPVHAGTGGEFPRYHPI